ncbi:uncharacterized protein [Typha latifolia]|uniref:uncharacterized protein n=1 Tax=Typha latifolia TaxID=4733 RepID=UPI003C2D11A4
MTTNSSQTPSVVRSTSSEFFVPVGSNDPGWQYGYLPNKIDVNTVKCRFCGKVTKGGISRFKKHIAHVRGDVAPCPKATDEAKKAIKEHIEGNKRRKEDKSKEEAELRAEVNIFGEKEDPEILEVGSKRPRSRGPLDKYTSIDPEVSIRERGKMVQTSIKDTFAKEQRDRVLMYLAHWVYKCGIPFNVVTDKSFHILMEAVGQYGPGFKPATMHELREPLLKKQVAKTNDDLENHRAAWKKNGCSILTDAWTDRKGRSIMNLCVNCELGVSFLRSVDCSKDSHTGEYIHNIVVEGIKEVGEENVLQVVTDNAAANLAVARLLKQNYPRIYWTSCAAHCIDLMLEMISKEGRIRGSIERGREITVFIYGHHKTLSLMRQFTQKREIVRPGVTRFATSFLTLQSFLEKKEKLRLMFTSDEFLSCKWSKTAKGKRVYSTILNNQFWRQVSLAVKVFTPLVKLLRIVDGERKPPMGFIYGGLKDVKKEIKNIFNNNETSSKPFLDAIDHYTNGKLDTHLHAAAYYLNPYYFYRDLDEMETDFNVMDGVLNCIENFYPDQAIQVHISNVEMKAYKDATGIFGRPLARLTREVNNDEFNPANFYGYTPYLKCMAVKILNLTCSSSGCERNWSSFEWINRLEVKRLNDLVYVQFNARMKDRKIAKEKDPVVSKERNNAREWLDNNHVEQEVFPGEGLTWEMVTEASGAEEYLRSRRSTRSTQATTSSTPSTSLDEQLIESDEETDDEEDVELEFDDDSDDNLLVNEVPPIDCEED